MDEILAVALHSMHIDMARLDQVAMNLANVSTAGYKRGLVVQGAGQPGANFAQVLDAAGRGGATPGVPAMSVATDLRAGSLKATGQSLDVAIAGDGYFEVMTDSGPAYTRQGSFRLDARGRLVTAQGHAVIGSGGEIVLNTSSPTIAANGAITEPGVREGAPTTGQLKVVRFPADAKPETLGNGLVSGVAGMTTLGAEETQLRQGYLEASNVNSAHEMTQLMLAMRHFETMQRVIQSRDEMLGTAIRKLGENA